MIEIAPDLMRSESTLPFTFTFLTLMNHEAVLQAIHLYSKELASHDEQMYLMSVVIGTSILPALTCRNL